MMCMSNEVSEIRHKTMSRIKSKDTKIEVMLRKALWKKGYRYRKNARNLPGKPDIVLAKHKIVIFCDSEFFHGKNWAILKPQLQRGNNSEYWITKISRNMERDDEVNKKLLFAGWTVIRFWGKEIERDLDQCIAIIEETIFNNMIMDSQYDEIE